MSATSEKWSTTPSGRLERARYQYENMLLSLSADTLDDTSTFDINLDTYRDIDMSERSQIHKEYLSTRTPTKTPTYYSREEFSDACRDVQLEEKDAIIVSLQAQVEKLQNQLKSTTETVEQLMSDTRRSQQNMEDSARDSERHFREQVDSLTASNKQLQELYAKSQQELKEERRHLQQALRHIERLSRRHHPIVMPAKGNLVNNTSPVKSSPAKAVRTKLLKKSFSVI